jgi:hypothetical protein
MYLHICDTLTSNNIQFGKISVHSSKSNGKIIGAEVIDTTKIYNHVYLSGIDYFCFYDFTIRFCSDGVDV